jgi:hypothetical protein
MTNNDDLRKYVLALDGAYYVDAVERLNTLANLETEYDRWATVITAGHEEIVAIESRYYNPMDAYDEFEPLVTKMDRDWQSFSSAAEAFIPNAVAIYILGVACLEAHINMLAEERLPSKSFDEFDHLSLVGKWLFYPILVSAGSFDPGAEPFQSFQQVVRRRNALIH